MKYSRPIPFRSLIVERPTLPRPANAPIAPFSLGRFAGRVGRDIGSNITRSAAPLRVPIPCEVELDECSSTTAFISEYLPSRCFNPEARSADKQSEGDAALEGADESKVSMISASYETFGFENLLAQCRPAIERRAAAAPNAIRMLSETVAAFCNQRAIVECEGWGVRIQIRADIMPETILNLAIAAERLKLRFCSSSQASRELISTNEFALRDLLIVAMPAIREIHISIECA